MRRRSALACVVACLVAVGCVGPSLPHEPGYAREETRAAMLVALSRTPVERVDALLEGARRRIDQLERLDVISQAAHAAALADAYRLILEQGVRVVLSDEREAVRSELLNIDHTLTWQLVRLDALRGRWTGSLRLELDRARRATEEVRDLGRAGAPRER